MTKGPQFAAFHMFLSRTMHYPMNIFSFKLASLNGEMVAVFLLTYLFILLVIGLQSKHTIQQPLLQYESHPKFAIRRVFRNHVTFGSLVFQIRRPVFGPLSTSHNPVLTDARSHRNINRRYDANGTLKEVSTSYDLLITTRS